MDKKKIIFDFIKRHKIAVISTVGQDLKPESAVLEFGETEDLEIIFDTLASSRKYKNLQTNKNVSFVIGWDENITVQYEGIAMELTRKDEDNYKEMYWSKNPEARRWAKRRGIVYFRVMPTWIRYSDLNGDLWKIEEINSF